jgi:hypothetical protein
MKLFAFTLLAAATVLTGTALVKNSPFEATAAFARQGADDPAGHNRRGRGADDPAGHASIIIKDETQQIARRGRGKDDPAGHASITVKKETIQIARRGRGKDDPVGHG